MAAKKSEARYGHKKSREALRCRTTSWDDEVDLVLNLQQFAECRRLGVRIIWCCAEGIIDQHLRCYAGGRWRENLRWALISRPSDPGPGAVITNCCTSSTLTVLPSLPERTCPLIHSISRRTASRAGSSSGYDDCARLSVMC